MLEHQLPAGTASSPVRVTDRLEAFRAFVRAVKGATDLVDVISADVELRAAGTTLKGLSPFRDERTPSFVVWPITRTWRDFSGGGSLGGDVFAYVMERDRLSFREAVERLAERAGVARPRPDEDYAAAMARQHEQREVFRLLSEAAGHLHASLPGDVRERWYGHHYGFTDATIEAFQLGWADGGLYRRMLAAGRQREDLLRTGLFVVKRDGSVVDFFQGRLVFPYWKAGQVRYFAARKTERTPDAPWEDGKYKKLLTRSERHAYVSDAVRNETFFNEDDARTNGVVLVTEGITDCISAVQAGLASFSPCTTRFRAQDERKLIEVTARAERVVVCNDAETSGAGHEGALQTAALLDAAGLDVRIATLPRGDGVDKVDVNAFLKANSPDQLRDVVAGARRYVEELLAAIPAGCPKLDLEPRLRAILDVVARKSPLEQDAWIDHIVERFGTGRRVIRSMLSTAASSVAQGGGRAEAFKGEVFEGDDHYYAVHSGERIILSHSAHRHRLSGRLSQAA